MLIRVWNRWNKGPFKDYLKNFQRKYYLDKRSMIGGGRWGKRSKGEHEKEQMSTTYKVVYLGKRPRPLRLGKREPELRKYILEVHPLREESSAAMTF